MDDIDGKAEGILLGPEEMLGSKLGFSEGDVDKDGAKVPSIVGLAEIEGWFEGPKLGIELWLGLRLGRAEGHMLMEG